MPKSCQSKNFGLDRVLAFNKTRIAFWTICTDYMILSTNPFFSPMAKSFAFRLDNITVANCRNLIVYVFQRIIYYNLSYNT